VVKYVLPEDEALRTKVALMRPANETLNAVQRLLRGCKDADVTFIPVDPLAHDSAASGEGEAAIAWTLGHIVVHMTATTEESAALAAELARGVPFHGRSRTEVPWQTITSVKQCRARLAESRRMRLASLDMWPEHPDLSLSYVPWDGAPEHNAIQRFMIGIRHEATHLDQIRDVIAQARTQRRHQTWWWRLFHPRARRSSAGAGPAMVESATGDTARLAVPADGPSAAAEAMPAPVPSDARVHPIGSGPSDAVSAE
jgi:hypothetical protein